VPFGDSKAVAWIIKIGLSSCISPYGMSRKSMGLCIAEIRAWGWARGTGGPKKTMKTIRENRKWGNL
jgi:hypothetical protein